MTSELNPCNYPFERIPGSFVYDPNATTGDGFKELERAELNEAIKSNPHWILSYGSNSAKIQLIDKFKGKVAGEIYGVDATLEGYDVVFGYHISQKGYIPATLESSSKTSVPCHILLLTDDQLKELNIGEGYKRENKPDVYNLKEIDISKIKFASPFEDSKIKKEIKKIETYFLKNNYLSSNGNPIALSVVQASGRIWPDKTEKELLSFLAKREGFSLDEFVKELKKNESFRHRIKESLGSLSLL